MRANAQPRTGLLLAVLGMILLISHTATAQESKRFRLDRSVMAESGTDAGSDSWAVRGTLGQPSAAGRGMSGGLGVSAGFWASALQVLGVWVDSITLDLSEGVRISWEGASGAVYTVEYRDRLSTDAGDWYPAEQLDGLGGRMEWLDDGEATGVSPLDPAAWQRFYRVLRSDSRKP